MTGQAPAPQVPFAARAQDLRLHPVPEPHAIVELQQRLARTKEAKVARLAEVRCLIQDAEELKGKLFAPSSELDRMGWPRKDLAQLQELLFTIDQWDELLTDVKQRLSAPSTLGGPALLKQLAELWSQLRTVSRSVHLDLDDRARAAQGLLSALLDRLVEDAQTMPGLRLSLEAVLQEPKIRETLSKDLDVLLPDADLGGKDAVPKEAMPQESIVQQEAPMKPLRLVPAASSTFITSIRSGDFAAALKLWGASGSGVHLHEFDGSESCLHLIAGCKKYNEAAAELFAKLLAAANWDIVSHRNASGQTFLHCAAGRLNCRILAQALSQPKLAPLFAQKDCKGQTPMSILAKHLAARGQPQRPVSVTFPCRSRRASEGEIMTVEVEDEAEGKVVSFSCDRSLLQLSKRFSQEFRGQPHTLKVAPDCCRSAKVIQEAFAMLSGAPECSTTWSGRELWQLLSFSVQYALPMDLKTWATNRLLQCIKDEANVAVLPMLLRGAHACGLSLSERRYVLYCMLSSPNALLSAGHSENGQARQVKVLQVALTELEALTKTGDIPESRAIDVPLQGTKLRSAYAERAEPADPSYPQLCPIFPEKTRVAFLGNTNHSTNHKITTVVISWR